MWLLVGLGNPGDDYKNNRHNIGFMVMDAVAEHHVYPAFRKKFEGLTAEGQIEGQKVVLLKPQTFMNNSGQSVKAAAKFYKVDPSRIIVFHDELDLEPGKVRIKQGGGNAGHNGLRSIEAHLGTADYWRVRLGIGHPGDKGKVQSHVLKDFSKTERKWLETFIKSVGHHIDLLVKGDHANFLNRIALEVPEKKKSTSAKEAGQGV